MIEIQLVSKSHATLAGRFDASQCAHAREIFDQMEGNSVLDLAELRYISSAGISELLLLYKRLNADGCEVRVQNASGHVKNIFEIAGLKALFPMD